MSLLSNVSMSDLKEVVGDDVMDISMAYVREYYAASDLRHESLFLNLKAIANSDGSFSIYEEEFSKLLVVVLPKRGGYHGFAIQPMGLCMILAAKVLGEFDMLDKPEEFDMSVYSTLFKNYELPDEERIRTFIYYMGIITIDILNLDIYKSTIKITPRGFTINGAKEEFVDSGGDTNYEKVSYMISMNDGDDFLSVIKMYSDAAMKDDMFTINVYDMIYKILNE